MLKIKPKPMSVLYLQMNAKFTFLGMLRSLRRGQFISRKWHRLATSTFEILPSKQVLFYSVVPPQNHSSLSFNAKPARPSVGKLCNWVELTSEGVVGPIKFNPN